MDQQQNPMSYVLNRTREQRNSAADAVATNAANCDMLGAALNEANATINAQNEQLAKSAQELATMAAELAALKQKRKRPAKKATDAVATTH